MGDRSAPKHEDIGKYLAFTFAYPQEALADLVADPRGESSPRSP